MNTRKKRNETRTKCFLKNSLGFRDEGIKVEKQDKQTVCTLNISLNKYCIIDSKHFCFELCNPFLGIYMYPVCMCDA